MTQNSWETAKRILTVHLGRSNVVRAEGYVLNRRDTGWNRDSRDEAIPTYLKISIEGYYLFRRHLRKKQVFAEVFV